MNNINILAIESSCDDTSAAVLCNGVLKSNVNANQSVHSKYGGVVPELASRAHQANIIPVVDLALKEAGIKISEISAVAFTQGPGLLGSLLVGTSFAKGISLARNIPIIGVNHLQGHVAALFISENNETEIKPVFPFLTLLVSGGHTQILSVSSLSEIKIIGNTIDDAAGEAFDKCAKILGLEYPGGPLVDKLAQKGDKLKFKFTKPKVGGLDFSFSGLKTAFMYFIRDNIKVNENFISENLNDICASLQHTIVEILLDKLKQAVDITGIREIAVAGGVSANSGLRNGLMEFAQKHNLKLHIPKFKFTTDNAGMIAQIGYLRFLEGKFDNQSIVPLTRMSL